MIAVIFEVLPKKEKWEQYLDLAAALKTELEKIEGFLSVERFQSISDPAKILSLSFWQDEESVREWRNKAAHRDAQNEGRNSIFEHYRLRIANVVRDYGMHDRVQAPTDSKIIHS